MIDLALVCCAAKPPNPYRQPAAGLDRDGAHDEAMGDYPIK
ncbi:MAG: hypothetical protein ABIP07_08035 [Sphingomicrobium sp.]